MEAEQQMDARVLQQVLQQVFVPLLEQQALARAAASSTPLSDPHARVLSGVQELLDILQHVDQQIPGILHHTVLHLTR